MPVYLFATFAAIACGAFHIRSGGRAYFNTTPLGDVPVCTACSPCWYGAGC